MDNALGRAQDLLVGDVLQSFGAEIAPGGLAVLTDVTLARNCAIPSNMVLVAVLALTANAPVFARTRFPTLGLLELVVKQHTMGQIERCALAAAAGNELPLRLNTREFINHLVKVIKRYRLHKLFSSYSHRNGGISIKKVDENNLQVSMSEWRDAYEKLSSARQILVATILCLDCQSTNLFWIEDLPDEWNAVDAITVLKAANMLDDWAKLVALWSNYESPRKYA